MRFVGKLKQFIIPLIPIYQRKVILEVRRNDSLPPLEPLGADIRIEQVTAENVDLVSHFRGRDVVEHFRRFLAQGDLGLYAFCGERVVGHGWAAIPDGSRRLIWGYMPVTNDTISFMFYSIDPQYRGRKIFQHVLAELIKLTFSKTGVGRILSDVNVRNAPSLAGCERVGFRRICVLPIVLWLNHTFRLGKIPDINADRA